MTDKIESLNNIYSKALDFTKEELSKNIKIIPSINDLFFTLISGYENLLRHGLLQLAEMERNDNFDIEEHDFVIKQLRIIIDDLMDVKGKKNLLVLPIYQDDYSNLVLELANIYKGKNKGFVTYITLYKNNEIIEQMDYLNYNLAVQYFTTKWVNLINSGKTNYFTPTSKAA